MHDRLLPCRPNARADLRFDVITQRYGMRSTVMTSKKRNKPFSERSMVFGSAGCVSAIVDHVVHKIEIRQDRRRGLPPAEGDGTRRACLSRSAAKRVKKRLRLVRHKPAAANAAATRLGNGGRPGPSAG